MPAFWYTTLEHDKRNNEIVLFKKYNEEEYPKFDRYDAINVDRVKHIPCDYNGIIGVPITFMNKYNPKQFKIVGMLNTSKITDYNFGSPSVEGKHKYIRILIKYRNK